MTSSIIVTPIAGKVWEFMPNLACISLEARKLYDVLCEQQPILQIKLSIEMFEYYVTALLWARLLNIKHVNGFEELSEKEYAYRAFFTKRFYVPYHMYEIFGTIGNVVNNGRTNRTFYLAGHSLPLCVAGGKGGYHAGRIDTDNHNLFEEVPSLGVIGDSLMASAIGESLGWGLPNFPFLPSDVTKAAPKRMVGYYGPVEGVNEELRCFLSTIAVSPQNFAETVPNTRFNINIIEYVSSILSEAPDMRRVCILEMDSAGSGLQLVGLFPTWTLCNFPPDIATSISWMEVPVAPSSYVRNLERLNSVNLLRCWLYKEAMLNSHANWCCVEARWTNSWQIPNEWIQNRNARRGFYHVLRRMFALSTVSWDTARRSLQTSLDRERRRRCHANRHNVHLQQYVPIIMSG